MGLKDDFREWTCDKCKKTEYIQRGGSREAAWGECERINADGASNKRQYCPDCKQSYRQMTQKQDEEFNTWLNGEDN